MSPEEAAAAREPLTDFYKNLMLHGDQFIQATTVGHEEVFIWGSIDEDSIDLLVSARLRRAQRSAIEAKITRGMVAIGDRFMEIMLLGPRAAFTLGAYWERGFDIPGGNRRKRSKRTVEGTVANAATGSV